MVEGGRKLTQSQSTARQRMMKRLLLHREALCEALCVSVSPTHRPTLRHQSRQGRATVRLNIETRTSECIPALCSLDLLSIRTGLSVLFVFFWAVVCLCVCRLSACGHSVSQTLTAEGAWEMYICTRALGNIRRGEGRKRNEKGWGARC